MDSIEKDWVAFENPLIYDGWILEFHPKTREIKWRDFYITQRLSPEKKLEIEEYIKNLEFNG